MALVQAKALQIATTVLIEANKAASAAGKCMAKAVMETFLREASAADLTMAAEAGMREKNDASVRGASKTMAQAKAEDTEATLAEVTAAVLTETSASTRA